MSNFWGAYHEGVLFSKDGVSFSGSHIDRSCSYSKLTFALEQNAKQALSPPLPSSETESFIGELGEAIENFGEGLFESNAPAVDVAELVFQRKLRNQATEQRTQSECLQLCISANLNNYIIRRGWYLSYRCSTPYWAKD